MFESLELTRMAQALASHAGQRLSVVARNVAHADTPGFKAQDIADFADLYREREGMRATRALHLQAASRGAEPFVTGGAEEPNGNTVSLELEMVKSAEARLEHEMALAIYRATAGVLRSALGQS